MDIDERPDGRTETDSNSDRPGKERIVTDTATPTDPIDAETHRRLGKDLYNHTWSLIEMPDRTPEQDLETIPV